MSMLHSYPLADAGAPSFAMLAATDMAAAVRSAIPLAAPSGPVNFRFAYGEIPVTGAIMPDGAGYALSLEAVAGVLPYSLEDRDTRAILLSAVDRIARATNGNIFVNRHQAIVVAARQSIQAPLSAVSVLSGLVVLMTEMRAVLEALAAYLPDLGSALPAAADS